MSSIESVPSVLIVLVLMFVVAFLWLIPIFIWLQLRQVIRLLKEIRESSERIAENTRPAGQRGTQSSVRYTAGTIE